MRLVIENVSKRYRHNVWGLRNLSLELGPGILSLIGPNGAGKSTLLQILATVTRPTEGAFTWDGNDVLRTPDRLRRVLGYLPQDFGTYPNLNAVEFLEYLAAMRGLDGRVTRQRVHELLEMVNLTGSRKRPLGSYSGGMRQRVGIAQALLNDPQLLVLDEPTVGLDPEERVRLRNLLSELSGERIIIFSTHIVSDVEAVAKDIAMIANGQLRVHKSVEALMGSVEGKVWEWMIPGVRLAEAKQRYLISGTIRRGDSVNARVVCESPPDGTARSVPPKLEDAYLYALGAGGPVDSP
jgi:ABC-2 type transport system ATP-binding protein